LHGGIGCIAGTLAEYDVLQMGRAFYTFLRFRFQ
jgi:hypothetical protein